MYDLDLRMGVDAKLREAELQTGTLSYAVDTKNIYIDALLTDSSFGRQLTNAGLAYGVRDNKERIVAEPGKGNYSFQIGSGLINNSDNSLTVGKYNIPAQENYVVLENFNLKIPLAKILDQPEQIEISVYTDVVFNGQELLLNNDLGLKLNIKYLDTVLVYGYFQYEDNFYKIDENTKVVYENNYTDSGYDYSYPWAVTLENLKVLNIVKNNDENFLFTVGNGTDELNRLNLLTINDFGGMSLGQNYFVGNNSLSVGLLNRNNHNCTSVFGLGNISKSDNETIVGQYNLGFYWSTKESYQGGASGMGTNVPMQLYAYKDYEMTDEGLIIPKNKVSFMSNDDNAQEYIGTIFAEKNSPESVTEPLDVVSVYSSITPVGGYFASKNQYPAKHLFTVGNGTSDTSRSDAFWVLESGKAYFKSDLSVGKNLSVVNKTTTLDLEVINETTVNNLNATGDITVNQDSVVTETELNDTRDEIMSEVNAIASSITSQIWSVGANPPSDTKLLWIRTGTGYGNGIIHYYTGNKHGSQSLNHAISCKSSYSLEYGTGFEISGGQFVLTNVQKVSLSAENIDEQANVLKNIYIKLPEFKNQLIKISSFEKMITDSSGQQVYTTGKGFSANINGEVYTIDSSASYWTPMSASYT